MLTKTIETGSSNYTVSADRRGRKMTELKYNPPPFPDFLKIKAFWGWIKREGVKTLISLLWLALATISLIFAANMFRYEPIGEGDTGEIYYLRFDRWTHKTCIMPDDNTSTYFLDRFEICK